MEISKFISQEELEICRQVFNSIDDNQNDDIEISELKDFLNQIGYQVEDRELFQFLSEISTSGIQRINFDNFVQIIIKQKLRLLDENDQNILNTFIALGGNQDKTGEIKIEQIKKVLTEIFDGEKINNFQFLTCNTSNNDTLNYEEFKKMLNN